MNMRLKNLYFFPGTNWTKVIYLIIYIINGFICFSVNFLSGIMQIITINRRVAYDF